MGCSTTFMGIILGFFIGNIPGAFIGGLIGYIFESSVSKKSSKKRKYRYNTDRNRQKQVLLKYLFAMLAKFCQADGQVTREEIRIIDSFVSRELGLNSAERKAAIKYFDEAKSSSRSFSHFAQKFARVINHDNRMSARVIQLMQSVGSAGGHMSPEQSELLEEARNILQFSRQSSGNNSYSGSGRRRGTGYINHNSSSELREAYKTLDLDPDASLDKVKKRYRELAKKYHPDRAIARDVPEEFVEMAKEKFSEIKEAYDLIMEAEKGDL